MISYCLFNMVMNFPKKLAPTSTNYIYNFKTENYQRFADCGISRIQTGVQTVLIIILFPNYFIVSTCNRKMVLNLLTFFNEQNTILHMLERIFHRRPWLRWDFQQPFKIWLHSVENQNSISLHQ